MSAFEIRSGDVLEQLHQMPDASYSGVLTDPPYGLTSKHGLRSPQYGEGGKKNYGETTGGFMGMKWDSLVPGVEVWREVFRVLKPGSMLLAFGGTRTHHRLMCAIEDAGFEIRDCCMFLWVYGAGFPKSHNISAAIDKQAGAERTETEHYDRYRDGNDRLEQTNGKSIFDGRNGNTRTLPATDDARAWSGYGTALKPSYEPIVLAMKPLDGTFALNALRHGVAGLNIDGSRIGNGGQLKWEQPRDMGYHGGSDAGNVAAMENPSGRWPSNLILDRESAMLLDQASGDAGGGFGVRGKGGTTYAGGKGFANTLAVTGQTVGYGDSGGASRFFYIAKADASERHSSGQNQHPTVKPVDLCAYLAKLILPPETGIERKLLVPFSGSGSEIMGALRAGWDSVTGIEADPAYVELSERRIQGDAPLFNEAVGA